MDQFQCIQLIESYKQYPVLWNSNEKAYYSKTMREDAWREIEAALQIPVQILKTKMKSLMGTYRSEKSRQNKSRLMGSVKLNGRQLIHEPFLKLVITSGSGDNSIPTVETRKKYNTCANDTKNGSIPPPVGTNIFNMGLVVFSEKGKELLLIEGYKFAFHKNLSNNNQRWTCVSRKTRCKAYVKTKGTERVIVYSVLDHNHDQIPEKIINRQNISNSAKRAAICDLSEHPMKLIRKEFIKLDSDTITTEDVIRVRNKSVSATTYDWSLFLLLSIFFSFFKLVFIF